ncbi:MAG: hypothetical protein CM1200mP14_16380 [Gammaproteobacteria bacterium]|nr:MAG: hypothetical protein CM1200mP14_16380 [Gammaproteobacteria bacterium]
MDAIAGVGGVASMFEAEGSISVDEIVEKLGFGSWDWRVVSGRL